MNHLNKDKKLFLVFVDNDIYNVEYQSYLHELGYTNEENILEDSFTNAIAFKRTQTDNNHFYTIRVFDNIKSSIDFLKTIKFRETVIIINENLFTNFVENLNNNLNNIYIIPKIIIFSQIKRSFSLPSQIKHKEFYLYGGVKTSFEDIKNYIPQLIKIIQHQPNIQLIERDLIQYSETLVFEKVENWKDLVLPMFYQNLIYTNENKNNSNINFIRDTYNKYNNDPNYNGLLNQLINVPDIPIELLSKYYIRLYTIDGIFFKQLQQDLSADNFENNLTYLPYIQTLYNGLQNKVLKPCKDIELYCSFLLLDYQIQELWDYQLNQNQGLPKALVFSKNFLIFNKNFNDADNSLINGKNTLLTLVNSQNKFDSFSQIDVEELSPKNKRQVLFLPFSAFGVEEFGYDDKKQRYTIRLTYLGKYCDFQKIENCDDYFPKNKFKNNLKLSGLLKEDTIDNMKIKELPGFLEKRGKINKDYSKEEKCCCFIF